jgi:hypothetical protein
LQPLGRDGGRRGVCAASAAQVPLVCANRTPRPSVLFSRLI